MMRSLWLMRVLAKRLLCRVTTVIEFCDRCGVRQPVVWTARPDLWLLVTEQEGSGVFCPHLLLRAGRSKGHLAALAARSGLHV